MLGVCFMCFCQICIYQIVSRAQDFECTSDVLKLFVDKLFQCYFAYDCRDE